MNGKNEHEETLEEYQARLRKLEERANSLERNFMKNKPPRGSDNEELLY